MIAERVLLHPPQHAQLDLRDVCEVYEVIVVYSRGSLAPLGSLRLWGPGAPRRFATLSLDSCLHGIGVLETMSSITCSDVRPWLVACGPSQMRWLSTYFARSCTSSGYTSARCRTSTAQTFTSRPQQIVARGEAPRSTCCSTISTAIGAASLSRRCTGASRP